MTHLTSGTTKFIALVAAVTLTGFAALPASAASGSAVTVTVDRTELATQAGAKRIYAKLEHAAEAACQNDSGVRDLGRKMAAKECTSKMLEGFVRQVNSSRMSTIYAVEMHRSG